MNTRSIRAAMALAGAIAALVLAGSPLPGADAKKVFRAGAYAMDITPRKFPISVNGGMQDRQAKAASDRLHARCLVLDDGTTRLAIAVCDSCMIPRDILDEAKRRASQATGIPTDRIIFSGVGKTTDEMRAALEVGILLFNVESLSELRALDAVARELGVKAPVALRVNPDVNPQTHAYIATGLRTSKFGIPYDLALEAYEEAAGLKGVEVVGADMHIGSQLTKAAPFADAVARIASLVKTLRERAIEIRLVDVGGGLGIRYRAETPPTHQEYATVLLPALRELGVTVLLEPGRSIVGNAGLLLTRVLYRKDTGEKKFVIIDAAMNDLIRPPLYDAYHEIRPVNEARLGGPVETVDVVGPVCESGDFVAKDRELAQAQEGDLLAIMSAGAYGFAMSSNYNTRPRAVEVLVDGDSYTIVRRRETYEDLVAGETAL